MTPEKEEAYWFAIHYLARVIFEDILEEQKQKEVEDQKVPSSPAEG